MARQIQWGILGSGGIAGKFAVSSKVVKDATLVAVASRTSGKARAFADKHGVKDALDSYGALVARKDIDAVYVATTHNFHYECVKLALEAGKHVLCEKPFMMNEAEATELIALARRRRLFLMEGMWTRFLPAVVRVREWLRAGKIGEIRQVRADFGFRIDFLPEHRLLNPDLAGGALLDAGIYPISFASMVLGPEPQEIRAVGEIGRTGVDEQSAYLFRYPDGKIAMLSSAVRTQLDCRAVIYGTNGRIVIPHRFLTTDTSELHVDGAEPERFHEPFKDQEGFRWEIEAVSEHIRRGDLESPIMPLDETLRIARIIDEIKRQLGLVYANDRR